MLGLILAWLAIRLTATASGWLATGAYRKLVPMVFFGQSMSLLACFGFGLILAVLSVASFSSVRYKMMLAFALSLVLSIIGVDALLIAAYELRDLPFFGDLLRLLRDTSTAIPAILVIGIAAFALVFLVLSAETIRFIERLHVAIHDVAKGDLDVPMPTRSPDELGKLSGDLSRMVQELKAMIERERASEQARYDLVTSVSHDLRTPLTSILGYLQLVDEDKYVDEIELRHYVAVARDKCLQLQRMVEQLFEFTRTSHGAVKLAARPVNLAELVEQLAEEFVPSLQSAGMDYRLRLPTDRVDVAADPDLLVRVFENLISNAIRYGESGGVVELELEREGSQAVVRVINRSEPIPESELPHLFESFYRVEKSRSTATGGAGLGLAIARNIVTLHGGAISARNGPDRQLIFEVRLPLPSR